jgi:hypothetical protein
MLQRPNADHDCVNDIYVNGIASTNADHFGASGPAYRHRIGDQAASYDWHQCGRPGFHRAGREDNHSRAFRGR